MSSFPSWIENALACGCHHNRKLSIAQNQNGFWEARLLFEDETSISGWGHTTSKAIEQLNLALMEDCAAEMRRKGAA